MSSFSIVRSLRLPVPVKLAFNNQERVDKLFERIASQVEPSVAELKAVFENEAFKRASVNKKKLCLLILFLILMSFIGMLQQRNWQKI